MPQQIRWQRGEGGRVRRDHEHAGPDAGPAACLAWQVATEGPHAAHNRALDGEHNDLLGARSGCERRHRHGRHLPRYQHQV